MLVLFCLFAFGFVFTFLALGQYSGQFWAIEWETQLEAWPKNRNCASSFCVVTANLMLAKAVLSFKKPYPKQNWFHNAVLCSEMLSDFTWCVVNYCHLVITLDCLILAQMTILRISGDFCAYCLQWLHLLLHHLK